MLAFDTFDFEKPFMNLSPRSLVNAKKSSLTRLQLCRGPFSYLQALHHGYHYLAWPVHSRICHTLLSGSEPPSDFFESSRELPVANFPPSSITLDTRFINSLHSILLPKTGKRNHKSQQHS